MLDYEKLKLAHDLAYKLAKKNNTLIAIEYTHKVDHSGAACDRFVVYGLERAVINGSIDELISHMQSLDISDAKYKVGDEVWLYDNRELSEAVIEECCANVRQYKVLFISGHRALFDEDRIYPTRDALIESQIEYWQSLRQCQHEPDGLVYTSNPPQLKCVKCGEFYR